MKRLLLSLAALAWLVATPAQAAITFVQAVTAHQTGGNPGPLSVSITSGAGHLLVAFASNYVGTGNPFAATPITDSAGNTWTVANGPTNGTGTNANTVVAYCQNCNAIVSGTVSINVTGGASNILSLGVVEYSGVALSGALDVHDAMGLTSSTASPSYTSTSATAQAAEVSFGFTTQDNVSVTVTEDGNYSPLIDTYNIAGVSALHVGGRILAATGTQTYAPTYSGATISNIGLVTFKAAGGAAIVPHNNMLLNVGP